MPGSIHVSVLDAFDLLKVATDGENVAVKLSIGMKEYTTTSSKVMEGKIPPWNDEFMFPVLNLRDNLFVVLLNEKGEMISKHEMSTPTIVEQGPFDVDLALDRGGKIKVQIRFMLTDEERQRIDMMRAAALKRREESFKKREEVALDSKYSSVNRVKEIENNVVEELVNAIPTVKQKNPEEDKNVHIGETNNGLFNALTQIFAGAAFMAAGIMIWTISRSDRLQSWRPGVQQQVFKKYEYSRKYAVGYVWFGVDMWYTTIDCTWYLQL